MALCRNSKVVYIYKYAQFSVHVRSLDLASNGRPSELAILLNEMHKKNHKMVLFIIIWTLSYSRQLIDCFILTRYKRHSPLKHRRRLPAGHAWCFSWNCEIQPFEYMCISQFKMLIIFLLLIIDWTKAIIVLSIYIQC